MGELVVVRTCLTTLNVFARPGELSPCPEETVDEGSPEIVQVVLRSLLYPGYVHFNCTGSNTYGAIYNGSGARNYDLPFML